jgi:hypothetical protein
MVPGRSREPAEKTLWKEVERARESYNARTAEFDDAMASIASEFCSATALEIELLGTRQRQAEDALKKALNRLNDLILRGILPQDLMN